MSVVELVRSWWLPRAFAVAVIASGAAACSSEVMRFDSNPYATRNDTTASIQQQQHRAPAGSVQTSSLPPPGGVETAPMPAVGVSGGGQGMASYHPGQSPEPMPAMAPQRQAQLPQTQSPHALPPPVSTASKATKASSAKGVHVVAPGDTLTRIARQHNISLTTLARLNDIPPHKKLAIGDRITVPATTVAARTPKSEAKAAQPKALSAPPKSKAELPKAVAKAPPKPAAGPVLASAQPAETVALARPAAEPPAERNSVRAGNGGLSFRWPAQGRIIAGFGPKTNGQTNDGTNNALPEGTPVKASDDGVVAYAGNELKGYGNLVLVRHADGYVTAYAHAKELLVKRGDPIKRGQTIARSGQTGNVDAPQLHFEIRKGPSPIDPMPHLSGG
jgi:murein DD-endopeptidase MepM/ murein hydrolase activator NlpD